MRGGLVESHHSFKRISVVAVLVGLIAAAHADDPTNLPVVRAELSDLGNNVVCYGDACAAILEQLIPRTTFPMEYEYLPLEPDVVDQNEFCQSLYGIKPTPCNASAPPTTPRTDLTWQPNGCGDENFHSSIAQSLVVAGYPLLGGTSLDQPANSVYFKSACDAHDLCYGMLSGKATCDLQFLNNLNNICSGSSNSACSGIALAYYTAVNNFGESAYSGSTHDYKCAVWSKEMKDSGCWPQ